MKYHKIHHNKKVKSEDEEDMILPGKEFEQKKKKRMISKLLPDLLSCLTHFCGFLAPKNVVGKDKSKRNTHPTCMMTFMHT